MLAKKNNHYCQVFIQDNGEVFSTHWWYEEYQALTDSRYYDKYPSLQALKNKGWEPQPLDWYNLSAGDWMEDKEDNHRILSADGFGELRVYKISSCNDTKEVDMTYTAYELKVLGYTPTQPKAVEDTCKECGQEVRIKKE